MLDVSRGPVKRKRFSDADALADIPLTPPTPVLGASKQVAGVKLVGSVVVNHRGFGFVTATDGTGYYLRKSLATNLLTGDLITFVLPDDASAEKEVKGVTWVERKPQVIMGVARQVNDEWMLDPDEPYGGRITLSLLSLTVHRVIEGDVVGVQLMAYSGGLRGKPMLVPVIARVGIRSLSVDFTERYVKIKYGFPLESVTATIDEPAGAPHTDMTDIPFVTIDGENTRDIDDAVYARKTQNGWEVSIAIADVSWYVREGSSLDQLASAQGTSLYLPSGVVAMLPESLSTDLCSLVPGVPRLAVVLTIQLDGNGVATSRQLSRGVIQSRAKLSYAQVANYLSGDHLESWPPIIFSCLDALDDVYLTLSKARSDAGKIEHEDPEASWARDSAGDYVVSVTERNDAHKLIEELMLLANRTAAEILVERYGVSIVRQQAAPTVESWAELREAVPGLPDNPCLKGVSSVLEAEECPDARFGLVLRVRQAMRPASYELVAEGDRVGHFSLSMPWYTHFTSPIRRYADLLVHRLLLAPPGYVVDAEGISQKVANCNVRAIAAKQAERYVMDALKLAMVLKHPEDASLPARIVKVSERGCRVVIQEWQCSAWLPGKSLRAKGYFFSEGTWTKPLADKGLAPGTQVQVKRALVLTAEQPAYPELQVDILGVGAND